MGHISLGFCLASAETNVYKYGNSWCLMQKVMNEGNKKTKKEEEKEKKKNRSEVK